MTGIRTKASVISSPSIDEAIKSTKKRMAELMQKEVDDNISSEEYEELKSLQRRLLKLERKKDILSEYTKKRSINHLGDGRVQIYIDGKRKKFHNEEEIADFLIERREGKYLTLNSIYEKFYSERLKSRSSNTCVQDQRYYDDYIKTSSMANKPLGELVLSDGYAFFDHCQKIKPDMKERYWNEIKGTLNQMIEYAIRNHNNIIKSNPFTYLKINVDQFAPASTAKEEDTLFSEEEERQVRILAWKIAKNNKDSRYLGIIVLLNLGIRIGELCALKWGDIDDAFSRIHIQREMVPDYDSETRKRHGRKIVEHCKSKAGDRWIPLNKSCQKALIATREYNKLKGLPACGNDFIFVRRYRGQITFSTQSVFYKPSKHLQEMLGIDVMKSYHDIRRTTITNLTDTNMNIRNISRFAGHKSIKTTMDYVRYRDNDNDRRLFEKLGELDDEAS